jgi:LysM repeat protein
MKRYLFVAATLGLIALLVLSVAACVRSRTASAMPSPIEDTAPAAGLTGKAETLQGGTSVIIAPPAANVALGATTVVEVQVQNVQGLYGVDIRLSFDPAKVEVQDANPGIAGVQIEPGPFLDVTQGFVAQNSADNTAGRINYAMTLLNPAEPRSGSGTLMRITFKGIAQGESAVAFLSALLSDRPGMQIPATTTNGTITVGPAGPTPTYTPTPTHTPVPGVTRTPTPTRTPGPTPTPGPTGPTCTYIVRPGDMLFSIARRFGTTASAIAARNGLRNINFIFIGQRLVIPNCTQPPPPPPPPGQCVTYVVRRGDTLSGIAARFGTTSFAIAARNGILNPHFIFVGQRLIVCRGVGGLPPVAGRVYVVRPGDTLFSIALRYGVTIQAIMSANGLFNPNLVFVGQSLRIP